MTEKDYEKLKGEFPTEYAVGDEYLGYADEIKSTADGIKKVGDFKGTYSDQIDKAVTDYLGRDKFNFNPNNSSTYQQLRNQYLGDGKKAMEDTLASAAMLSGGYNNSSAQVTAQQVYNDYAGKVTDAIPQLEAQEYERYLNENNMKLADIELMQRMDEAQYGRYLDEINQGNQKLSHLINMQGNAAVLDANKNNFSQSGLATLLGLAQNDMYHADDQANVKWEQGQAEKNALISNGWSKVEAMIMPSEEERAAMGVTEEQIQGYIDDLYYKSLSVSSGGGSGSSKSSSGGGNYTNTYLKQLYEDGDYETFFAALGEKYGSDEESIIAGAQNLGFSEHEIRYLNDGTLKSLEQAQYLLKNFGKEDYSDDQISRMLSGAYTEKEFYQYGHRDSGYDTYEEYLTACFKRFISDDKVDKTYKAPEYKLEATPLASGVKGRN